MDVYGFLCFFVPGAFLQVLLVRVGPTPGLLSSGVGHAGQVPFPSGCDVLWQTWFAGCGCWLFCWLFLGLFTQEMLESDWWWDHSMEQGPSHGKATLVSQAKKSMEGDHCLGIKVKKPHYVSTYSEPLGEQTGGVNPTLRYSCSDRKDVKIKCWTIFTQKSVFPHRNLIISLAMQHPSLSQLRLGNIPGWPKKRYDFGVIADTRYRPWPWLYLDRLKNLWS